MKTNETCDTNVFAGQSCRHSGCVGGGAKCPSDPRLLPPPAYRRNVGHGGSRRLATERRCIGKRRTTAIGVQNAQEYSHLDHHRSRPIFDLPSAAGGILMKTVEELAADVREERLEFGEAL